MERTNVTVVSHLKSSMPPDTRELTIVLEEVSKAIYGENVDLQLQEGSVGENEFENMVHFYSSMNAGIRHHIEGILDRRFGPHFIVGYNGQLDRSTFTSELDESERRIDERLNQ